MAMLWMKDNALLINDNGLSLADDCCCSEVGQLFASTGVKRSVYSATTPYWSTANLSEPPGGPWNGGGVCGSVTSTPDRWWSYRITPITLAMKVYEYNAGAWTDYSAGLNVPVSGGQTQTIDNKFIIPNDDGYPSLITKGNGSTGVLLQKFNGSTWASLYNNTTSRTVNSFAYASQNEWIMALNYTGTVDVVYNGTSYSIPNNTTSAPLNKLAADTSTISVQPIHVLTAGAKALVFVSYGYTSGGVNMGGTAICSINPTGPALVLHTSELHFEYVIGTSPAVVLDLAHYVGGDFWGYQQNVFGGPSLYKGTDNLTSYPAPSGIPVPVATFVAHNRYIFFTDYPEAPVFDTSISSFLNLADYNLPFYITDYTETGANVKSIGARSIGGCTKKLRVHLTVAKSYARSGNDRLAQKHIELARKIAQGRPDMVRIIEAALRG